MTPKKMVKKRVRIKSGHEARYIERQGRPRKKFKTEIKKKTFVLKGKIGGKIKSHRSTVSELVYQFLEKASKCGVNQRRKSNTTSQYRRLHRRSRSKRLRPTKRISSIVRHIEKDNNDMSIPSKQVKVSVEKCIYDILSFGTIMGLLQPVDKKGVVFRVASDLNLSVRKSTIN